MFWQSTAAWAVQATLAADTHVSSAQPSVNAGSLSNLNVGNGYTALIRFDLGSLPSGTTAAGIARATLTVFCNRADTAGSVSLQAVNGTWTENGVTYATEPLLGSVTSTATVSQAGSFVTFDVTSAVQAWISSPGSNFGVALTSSTAVVQFDSKENDETAHPPQLEIALAAGTGSGGSGLTGATGATGAAGSVGPQGATGAAGVVGARGATGSTGSAGATGIQGPAGAGLVNYLGAYSSTSNYANGDVVTFAGSTYISQTSSNHGNTPGLGGGWGLLASVGATGSTGALGATGVTGQQGPPGYGIQGATGATGIAGTTGATGTPGLVYQGAYSSVNNYALGDVVLWNGSSYASLISSNHGNTPGLVPGTWGQLTAQGPTGFTGATGIAGPAGATGSLGPTGPPGERGEQGAQGIAGQAGAQGIPGSTGVTGLQGPIGTTGPAGPTGLSFQGAYSSAANYGLGQGVLWQGAGWVSLINSNHGNTPDSNPGAWTMFAAQGGIGPAGATGVGVAGATGAAGPAGATGGIGLTGATGSTGAAGVNFIGNYNASTSYNTGDAVSYGGSSYVSLVASNHGQTPGQSAAAWSVLAAQGVAGPSGPSGATGATGSQGPAGTQGVTGAAGPTGATGAVGAQGLTFIGAWSQAQHYSVNQAVSFAGSSYLATVGNTNQEPDQYPQIWSVLAQAGGAGPQGAQGATGSSATVAVGTVTTLAAGAQATITNSGTSTAAVLNFGIPQGATGSGGSGGTASSTANPMTAAIYHAVSYAYSYYAINTTNSSASEATSVLAWMPRACTLARLDVFSQQFGSIRVTVRVGTPGNMADTALSCIPSSSTGSCSVTAATSVVAGQFLDLRVDYSSGTPAGVWTAVECDLTQ